MDFERKCILLKRVDNDVVFKRSTYLDVLKSLMITMNTEKLDLLISKVKDVIKYEHPNWFICGRDEFEILFQKEFKDKYDDNNLLVLEEKNTNYLVQTLSDFFVKNIQFEHYPDLISLLIYINNLIINPDKELKYVEIINEL